MARLFDDVQEEYLSRSQAVRTAEPFVMVCFFKSDDVDANQCLMALCDASSDDDIFRLAARGDLEGDFVQAGAKGVGWGFANTSAGYLINTWYHACAIFVTNSDRRAFIDGGHKGTDSIERTPVAGNIDTTSIGALDRLARTAYMSGAIAEAAIYDLSQWPGATDSDKADNFEAILPDLAAGYPPSDYPLGLIAYWSLVDDDLDHVGEFDMTAYNIPDWTAHPPMIRLMVSSATGISIVSGSLDSQPELIGSAVGVSGASGSLDSQSGLVGSIIGVSGVSGSLDSQPGLVSSTAGIFGAEGVLNVDTKLVGSVTGVSGVDGSLSFLSVEIIGSVAGVSGASGSLDTQPELGSSITEITGVSGSLGSVEVAIQLIGFIAGVSGAEGTLNVEISLVGEIIEAISVISAVCVTRGLWSIANGISSTEGFLSVVPDFDASTLFWRPQNDIVETLEWKTSILKANDGTEQRIKVRQSPRQYFKLEFIFPTNKLNTWYDSIIHTWQKLTWLIPVWSEYVEHLTDINRKDMTITVNTTNADFRNNSKAMVWKSSTEYEILVIDSKTNSQLNLSYSLLNSFSGTKYIIPVRTAYLISSSKKQRYNSEVSVVSLVFAVYDNIDQLEDYAVANYDGYEILDVPSFMDNTHLERSDGDIFIADFKTGIFKVESDSIYNFLSQNHSFFNDTKEACWNFRKFLYSLDGRQKVILIPTFRSDVVQTDNIAALDTSVKIENIGLVENMGFNSLRTYIGFYFPATGILMIRKITAITELDSLEEQIDFDANLGSLIESGDCKIGFVDKCRLASDKVEIRWPQAHKNECRTNFMRVP